MSGNTWHVAPFRPAPVAIHDDRDMFWEPCRIQMPVNVRFLAVEPLGYFVLQSDLSATDYHSREGGCNEGNFIQWRGHSCPRSASKARKLRGRTDAVLGCTQ